MTSFSQDTAVHTTRERRMPAWYASGDGFKTRTNVGAGERIGSAVIAAGVLAGSAWLGGRRQFALAAPLALGGLILVGRAATGQSKGYRALRVCPDDATAGSHPLSRRIVVRESFHIRRPPEELYEQWRDFASLPTIMSHLESVQTAPDGTSRWTTRDVGRGTMTWHARLTDDQPGRRIAWDASGEKGLEHDGAVTFEPATGGRGTILRVAFTYRPPGGALGAAAAKLLGQDPGAQLREDLRQFKHRMEAGESPTTQGQPRGSCEQ
jgi:uncharacterized membrane protein